MPYRVMVGDQVIGTSSLEYRDSAMGIAFGKFFPLPPYNAVRSVFLMFTDAQPDSGGKSDQSKVAAYYAARDKLGLALKSEDGTPFATAYIHIVDWGDGEEGQMEIEVQVTDPRFWGQS